MTTKAISVPSRLLFSSAKVSSASCRLVVIEVWTPVKWMGENGAYHLAYQSTCIPSRLLWNTISHLLGMEPVIIWYNVGTSLPTSLSFWVCYKVFTWYQRGAHSLSPFTIHTARWQSQFKRLHDDRPKKRLHVVDLKRDCTWGGS